LIPGRPINKLSEPELRSQLAKINARMLASPNNNSTADDERMTTQQTKIEKIEKLLGDFEKARQVESITAITADFENASISAVESMDVDDVNPPEPKPISAKQRVLLQYGKRMSKTGKVKMLPFDEAARLDQEGVEIDRQREEQRAKRRIERALSLKGGEHSRQEMDRLMQRFMNHKEIAESDSESDSDGPAAWFVDEEGEGIKGQQIVLPDPEDYSSVIRIDDAKAYTAYNTFYEPRDDD